MNDPLLDVLSRAVTGALISISVICLGVALAAFVHSVRMKRQDKRRWKE